MQKANAPLGRMVTRMVTRSRQKEMCEGEEQVVEQICQEEEEKRESSSAMNDETFLQVPQSDDLQQEELRFVIVEEEVEEEDLNENDADPDSAKFDGCEVLLGLWFGGEGCAMDAQGRQENGITHVLSILSTFEMGFVPDAEMVLTGNWKIYHRENRPTADMLNILDDCVDFINDAMTARGRICVHSLEGESRSVCVCLAYLVKTLGMNLRAAVELMKNNRPDIKLNRGFWRQIVAFEEHVHGTASFSEEELPGAIMFEREDLDKIIATFKTSKQERHSSSSSNAEPASPTTATGINLMSLGSPNSKRKAFDWHATAEPHQDPLQEHQRIKSPRSELAGHP
ncbi:Dual specificity protein phosphatase 1 (AtDsPTP1) [Durusdinium trenchii]|uniref:protein-tyrosine-phosphatase n=1 Tax=Durusdinium trenchii TaxID=1381693 RepID=A0ABP0J139_9DINO